uniref:LOW QUALITY PROTEIN: protein NRT1/ PTR FAMILY 2.3-like n=1 Tax=Elaeis guineensis var. tenera TaxID=51953 RepID=A0A8N4F4K6_ELAGV
LSLSVCVYAFFLTRAILAVSVAAVSLAVSGVSNIIVYLIKEYNVKSIDSAQIYNIVNGCTSVVPVAGAIIFDAYVGSFPIVAFSTITALRSLILLTLTAALQTLRPSPCPVGSSHCETPSAGQFATLYISLGLLAVGTGGTRFNTMTMGADQFEKPRDQDTFFNWYFVALYAGAIPGFTATVYVQGRVSWALGFGLCAAAGAIVVAAPLLGARFYHKPQPKRARSQTLLVLWSPPLGKGGLQCHPTTWVTAMGLVRRGKPPSSADVPSQSFRHVLKQIMSTE